MIEPQPRSEHHNNRKPLIIIPLNQDLWKELFYYLFHNSPDPSTVLQCAMLMNSLSIGVNIRCSIIMWF